MTQRYHLTGVGRAPSVGIGGTTVELPCFFPSISTVKANLPILEYLKLLVGITYPLFLISSYDIHHASSTVQSAIQDLLGTSISEDTIVLLDSGNYESHCMKDHGWSEEKYVEVCNSMPFRVALSFDQGQPCEDMDTIVEWVVSALEPIRDKLVERPIIPIVHAPRESLPAVCREVAERLMPIMLAVAERELGEGIIERARTVARIREALNDLGYYCVLHLLGTGNPLSILTYAFSGADSFDGLEWCQTCIDHETGRAYHSQHWDFFRYQTRIHELQGLPYMHMVMTHNLMFFAQWLKSIRQALFAGNMVSMLNQYLPESTVRLLTTLETGA